MNNEPSPEMNLAKNSANPVPAVEIKTGVDEETVTVIEPEIEDRDEKWSWGWDWWVKWIFSSNPAFILSAVLLLYAIGQLSENTQFLPNELQKLLFNFGTLQVYGLLLVGTAGFLARRLIWYDSTLLVWLENMLLFVPFILISQAMFLGRPIQLSICVAGGLLALGRGEWIRRYFAGMKFPVQYYLAGILILGVNLALPIVSRWIYDEGDPRTGELYLRRSLDYFWLYGVPGLVLLVNAIPRPEKLGAMGSASNWFACLVAATWVAATGVHLKAIHYVYTMPWNNMLLLPALFAAAWTLNWKLRQLVPELKEEFRTSFLLLPMMALVPAWSDLPLLEVFCAANGILYGIELWRYGRNSVLVHSLLGSLAMFGVVFSAIHFYPAKVGNTDSLVILVLMVYAVLYSLTTRDPRAALFASLAVVILTAIVTSQSVISLYIPLQSGLILLMVHSIWWNDAAHRGAAFLRLIAGIGWITTSLFWLGDDGTKAAWFITAIALLVILLGLAVGWIRNRHYPWMVIGIGVAVLIAEQGYGVTLGLKNAPTGIVTLGASFLLFAIGIGLALLKVRIASGDSAQKTN